MSDDGGWTPIVLHKLPFLSLSLSLSLSLYFLRTASLFLPPKTAVWDFVYKCLTQISKENHFSIQCLSSTLLFLFYKKNSFSLVSFFIWFIHHQNSFSSTFFKVSSTLLVVTTPLMTFTSRLSQFSVVLWWNN
jgi:hypothetical protein